MGPSNPLRFSSLVLELRGHELYSEGTDGSPYGSPCLLVRSSAGVLSSPVHQAPDPMPCCVSQLLWSYLYVLTLPCPHLASLSSSPASSPSPPELIVTPCPRYYVSPVQNTRSSKPHNDSPAFVLPQKSDAKTHGALPTPGTASSAGVWLSATTWAVLS